MGGCDFNPCRYTLNPACKQPTDIYVNLKLHYPHGYRVFTYPSGAVAWQFKPLSTANTSAGHILITPKASHAPAASAESGTTVTVKILAV